MVKRGAIRLFSGSKRGMSPLIATVLLIAFAVAMGAMIMNWSSNIGEGLGGPDCSGINIVMNPFICYKENMIKFGVRNDGSDVEEITVRVSDESTENDFSMKNSALPHGGEFKKDIPFVKTSQTKVQVIPSVNYNGKVLPCPSPALDLDLQECTS